MSSIPLSRVPGRLNRFRGVRNARISQHHQCFSCAARLRAQQDTTNPDKSNRERTTHFGFETIAEELKQSKGTATVSPYHTAC
jgi:2-methoxy-6-polyprenyl-1,4-benzoquinol methylase